MSALNTTGPDPPHPRLINSRYELSAKLGSGAFGEVFLGVDQESN